MAHVTRPADINPAFAAACNAGQVGSFLAPYAADAVVGTGLGTDCMRRCARPSASGPGAT